MKYRKCFIYMQSKSMYKCVVHTCICTICIIYTTDAIFNAVVAIAAGVRKKGRTHVSLLERSRAVIHGNIAHGKVCC